MLLNIQMFILENKEDICEKGEKLVIQGSTLESWKKNIKMKPKQDRNKKKVQK